MLWTIFVIFPVVALGKLIHLLLVVAVIILIINLVSGRRTP
jgi:hypothetical protein